MPIGAVQVGTGNKDGTVEGAVAGHIWATYLHGPVLARNPQLADLLLSWVVGPLGPLDDSEPDALHAERCEHGLSERRTRARPASPGTALRDGVSITTAARRCTSGPEQRGRKRGASTSVMGMRYLRWKRTPYVAPVAVLAAVGLVALVPTLSGASAPAGLPAQSAQQLVADIAGAKPPQLSGALQWTVNLGFSGLSALEQEAGQGGGGSAEL